MMGIFSKIKEKTNCSHFSICQTEEDELAIDLWDLNQSYKIDLKNDEIYFDTGHSDYTMEDLDNIKNFLCFLDEIKEIII